jgi:hypothetical protein
LKWWWLSYADEERGFLGAAIIIAPNFLEACSMAKAYQVSPVGQVQGNVLGSDDKKKVTLYDTMRLLNKEEAQRLVRLIDNE